MDRTITLENVRTASDVTMPTRLKDGGVAIDWTTLTDIKAWLYSDAQRAMAGRCALSIDESAPDVLVCEYSALKPQYPGVNRLIVQAKYMGRVKTYDKPVLNFVPRTAQVAGEQIVLEDPIVNVEIEVEDVTSSILDSILAACVKATEEAREVVDASRGPRGFSAYEVAVQNGFVGTEEEWLLSLQGKSAYEIAVELGYEGTEEQWIASLKGEDGEPGTTPHIGQNGNWFIGDVDTGVAAGGQNGVTPHIGQNGNWFIGDTDTGVLARGTNGVTPHIGENGHWYIGETDTGVLAEGTNGVTPHIGNNGHWYIGDVDTEVIAEGHDGTDGVGFDDASTPAVTDGTFIIALSNGNKVIVDMNHNHPQYYDKLVSTEQPAGGLLPDVAYELGTLTGAVTISLAAAASGHLNHYFFIFSTGSVAPTVTFPPSVTKWAGNCVTSNAPAIGTNRRYEVSILDGVGFIFES